MPGETAIHVEAQADHLQKLARTSPINALTELIWNSLDADATEIEIEFVPDEMGVSAIRIVDNGHGFSPDDAERFFGSLGGSWKRTSAETPGGRRLHGKEGQGRFRAFSLGVDVCWHVVYRSNGAARAFEVSGTIDKIDVFNISDPHPAEDAPRGVTVEVSNLHKQYTILNPETAAEALTPILAPYLVTYPNVRITVDGVSVEPMSEVVSSTEYELDATVRDDAGIEHSFALRVLEWDNPRNRDLYLCDENGFPLDRYDKQIRGIGDYGFSAYLRSSFVSKLSSEGTLAVVDIEEDMAAPLRESIRRIKDYFHERYIQEQRSVIERWKSEAVYPYASESPRDRIEEAERKVFDIVALNLNEAIDSFDESEPSQKRLQFSLLRQAIETRPTDLGRIIQEVIKLPDEKARELSELLDQTTLSAIISTSRLIGDRLAFIAGLEEIVFDVDLKRRLRERSQLHRILADNPWVFGDEFSLSVDDQSLTEVLRKHRSLVGDDVVIDRPVLRSDGRTGIVDLMLSRSVPKNRASEREHLVVELKAPRVDIGQKEINQIQEYAFAVSDDERFRSVHTRWEFWIISSEIGRYGQNLLDQDGFRDGEIFKRENRDSNSIVIKVKAWSEVVQENKHRLQFVKDRLDLSISREDGIDYLQKKYAKYLEGVINNPGRDTA